MPIVNMLEAKSTLSRLVEALENGAETEFIIARNGKPAARLVPLAAQMRVVRFGLAEGMFDTPTPDPDLESEAAALIQKSSL